MAVLKEGSKAPVFKGVDQNGNVVSLKDFLGKRMVSYSFS
jgi:peroxiredoxin Q/BCP